MLSIEGLVGHGIYEVTKFDSVGFFAGSLLHDQRKALQEVKSRGTEQDLFRSVYD